MGITAGSALRVHGRAIVEPYPGMAIDELQTLKRAAERYYQVLPKDRSASIREWGVLIMEETRSRGRGRVYYSYSLRVAAEKVAGDLLSLFLKYGDPS